jgi:hypothetical protein
MNLNVVSASSQTLQPSDSLALIFYYQARGLGDSPELTDSLILDFFKPRQNKWQQRVWFSKGNANSNTNDTIFKRAFVFISDTAFLQDGFKFRLKNKATTAGNFDHWHVDYVYLDKNRSIIGDTVLNDISIGTMPSPYLKNYGAMPWQQYIPTEMAEKVAVRIRNNGSTVANMSYENKIYNKNSLQLYSYNGGANNLFRFKDSSWSKFAPHANSVINYSFTTLPDSADFKIKHFVYRNSGSNDFNKQNDTVLQIQKFRNYYALDDGTAEAGYYVNGVGGKMAMKFKLNFTDTLRAVRIYFDPVGNINLAQVNYKFRVNLWADGGGAPGGLLYRDSIKLPKYYSDKFFNAFEEYKLTTPLVLNAGTYFIGIQQQVATGIAVGFDRNLNHNTSLYFDSGSGWTQSSIYGSIMINPVVGKRVLPFVGVSENNANKYSSQSIYPNPANDYIQVTVTTDKPANYSISNSMGEVVLSGILYPENLEIDISQFATGIYFLTINSSTKKFIIAR